MRGLGFGSSPAAFKLRAGRKTNERHRKEEINSLLCSCGVVGLQTRPDVLGLPMKVGTARKGGLHNLSPWDAARLVQPAGVIPTHFDTMTCNQQDPAMFENSLKARGASARHTLMRYYEPYIYTP